MKPRLGDRIAEFLVEKGGIWSASELAAELDVSKHSVLSCMPTVRRHCNLIESSRIGRNGQQEAMFMALVGEGVGLLAMNGPSCHMEPYVVRRALKE